MDPNETWGCIQLAYGFEEKENLVIYTRELLDWLSKGGFPPEITIDGLSLEWDREFSRTVCLGVCRQILSDAGQEVDDAAC